MPRRAPSWRSRGSRTSTTPEPVNSPSIVFADEPTGNLDSRNGADVMALLMKFAESLKTTLVVVTHDTDLAGMGDRTLVIKDGRIV